MFKLLLSLLLTPILSTWNPNDPTFDHTLYAIQLDAQGTTDKVVQAFRAALKHASTNDIPTKQQHLGTALTTLANDLPDQEALVLYIEAVKLLQLSLSDPHPDTTESIEILEYNCWRRYSDGCLNAFKANTETTMASSPSTFETGNPSDTVQTSSSNNIPARVSTARSRLLPYHKTFNSNGDSMDIVNENTDIDIDLDGTPSTSTSVSSSTSMSFDAMDIAAYSIWNASANHHAAAMYHMEQSKWMDSVRSMRAAVANDPTSVPLRNNLAVLCMSIVRAADQRGGIEHAKIWLNEASNSLKAGTSQLQMNVVNKDINEEADQQRYEIEKKVLQSNAQALGKLEIVMLTEDVKEKVDIDGMDDDVENKYFEYKGQSKTEKRNKRRKKRKSMHSKVPSVKRISWNNLVKLVLPNDTTQNNTNKMDSQYFQFQIRKYLSSTLNVPVSKTQKRKESECNQWKQL